MARFWTITMLALATCGKAYGLTLARPERTFLYEIGRALQQHVVSRGVSNPEILHLNEFMRPEQLTSDQVHCSDFGIEFVTGTKHEWVFDIIYRPHMFGQPRALRARATVFPNSSAREAALAISGDVPPAPYARSPWLGNSAWDGEFRVRQRDRTVIGIAALLALPVGLAAGLIFAVWLARLRRNVKRKGAPSLGFMFALGSTLFVIVLGMFATPAASPVHWTLVAFLLPSSAVVSAGIVQLIFDRAQPWTLQALNAGEECAAAPVSAWRAGKRPRIDDVAEGYRLSWSTKRS